jgi:hypothetical protein
MSSLVNSILLRFIVLPGAIVFCTAHPARGTDHTQPDGKNPREKRIYNTVRIENCKPLIDGILDDECWKQGEWSGNYSQHTPVEGGIPSQQTEMKILYDNENIYVAFIAHDNKPDKIDRQMGRRDQFQGDVVGINFDSYFDHRTGFEFNLTAAGVKIDLMLTNDGLDFNWNAIWEGEVAFQDSSWTAEMRIPFSQLRYSNQEEQVWGLHSWRLINRDQEDSHWNLIPRDIAGLLYGFGELHGLKNLPRASRTEFMPYTVGKIRTYPKEEGNPFSDGTDPALAFGLDGKLGIGSNFTVDYTVNPDFGQVEADPSELNLTAFETFFEEKRPFFIEGRNIFGFGIDDNQLFYSRRIGHSPSYDPILNNGEYSRKPDNTSILGALKLTGKTQKGLSVGIVESLTQREYADVSSPGGDHRTEVEPMTNYFVGRVQKDINNSNTLIGGMVTSTYRDIDHEYLNGLARSAITGGFDFRHYMKNKTYYIDFKSMLSRVNGSVEAITSLQRASSRYYQRPDAQHLRLDTTDTRLSGHGGSLEFIKGANGKWRYGIIAHWNSPGLELNELGFQNNTDLLMEGQMIGYEENTPMGIFRSYEMSLTQVNSWNFGGEYLQSELELETEFIFSNKWTFQAEIDRESKTLDVHQLRGGPGVYVYGRIQQEYFIETDDSRKVSLGLGYESEIPDDRISASHGLHTEINWKVTNSLEVTPEFNFNKSVFDYQYITGYPAVEAEQYLLGRLHRKTYEITLRLNYALSPDLTIQYYGSPYITMGRYTHFKTLADPDTKDPGNVFRNFSGSEIAYDPGTRMYDLFSAAGPDPVFSFSNPDFNFRQFRSNLVARWEYRPGSVLYLVWTHNRTSNEDITNDALDYNFRSLFREHAENVFLVKFSYWFSL